MTSSPITFLGSISLLLAAASAGAQGSPERVPISGHDIAVWNLAGEVKIEPGSGSDVVVDVTRQGSDGAKLKVESGALEGRQTVRVISPGDVIIYHPPHQGGWYDSHTDLHVRDDGTFGDEGGHRGRGGDGRRVTIRSEGRGLDASATMRIQLPVGARLEVRLAVGKITASNVNGELRLDAEAADVFSEHTRGSVDIDTGSGDVELSDVQGGLRVDTGSGDVTVDGAAGDAVRVETGSGDIKAMKLSGRTVALQAGSGSIETAVLRAPRVQLETGSGDIEVALGSEVEELGVETGSGNATLRLPSSIGASLEVKTGSGEIDSDLTLHATTLNDRLLRGQVGDGKGTIHVRSGSGDVRLRNER